MVLVVEGWGSFGMRRSRKKQGSAGFGEGSGEGAEFPRYVGVLMLGLAELC